MDFLKINVIQSKIYCAFRLYTSSKRKWMIIHQSVFLKNYFNYYWLQWPAFFFTFQNRLLATELWSLAHCAPVEKFHLSNKLDIISINEFIWFPSLASWPTVTVNLTLTSLWDNPFMHITALIATLVYKTSHLIKYNVVTAEFKIAHMAQSSTKFLTKKSFDFS